MKFFKLDSSSKHSSSLPAVDLLHASAPFYDPPRQKRFFSWGKIFLYITTIIALTGSFFTYRAFSSIQNIIVSPEVTPLIQQFQYLVSNQSKSLPGQQEGRINFLIMGMGGQNHPGGLLADTIMVASLDTANWRLALISLPRDLIYDFGPPNYFRKINNAFVFGQKAQYPGGGGAYMRDAVSKVIGQPIQYYAWMDFEGFRTIVDDLGGIDVLVDNAFVDRQYPDYNYGWQTIRFEKGWLHMNGEKALQYSRSRHGNNGEGSDFKRSQRQKKVILATKEKLFSLHTVLNPSIIGKLLDSVSDHVRTNTEYWEIVRLAQMAQQIHFDQTIQLSIDNSAGGVLHSEIGEGGAYILVPNAGEGNYQDIHDRVAKVFTNDQAEFVQEARENPTIFILNGTKVAGLAKKVSDQITALNYNVASIGNADNTDYEKTVIYAFNDKNPLSLVNLKEYLQANVAPSLPVWLEENYRGKTVDFIIVVGRDKVSTGQSKIEPEADSKKELDDHFL